MLDLSVVIVTFKEDVEVLRRCFLSLQKSTGLSFEVIVTDNADREETEQELKQALPDAMYIANHGNKGFAYAVNQGLRLAKGRYALLLNPDTEFEPDVLQKMLSHLDQDTDVGIASGIIRYPNGEIQDSRRRFPSLGNQLLVLFKFPHLLPSVLNRYTMQDVDVHTTHDVNSLMGAFMFIRRRLLETIGLLDERYFIWYEEVDYCKMAYDAGWKIRHYAEVQITHHKGHSFSKLGTIRKQKWVRESLRKYIKKHNGFFPWCVLWLLTPLFIILGYLSAFLRRQ